MLAKPVGFDSHPKNMTKIPAYALYTTESKVPERQSANMPSLFRRRVCLCEQVDPKTEYVMLDGLPTRNGQMFIHNKCGKPESYFLYRCTVGKELFLKDFNALFCYALPTCWEHSKSLTELPCVGKNIPYHNMDWIFNGNLIPPRLKLPRVYTTEELGDLAELTFTI